MGPESAEGDVSREMIPMQQQDRSAQGKLEAREKTNRTR